MDDNKKSDLTETAKEKTAKAARSEHKRVKSDKKRSFNVVDVILFLMIDLLSINNMISKLVGQFVVIVSNYFLSKLWIFKKEKEEK